MKPAAAAIGLAFLAVLAWPPGIHAESPAAPKGALVLAVKATKACFSDQVRVTGFFVPRRVAVVNVLMDGYRIDQVLAAVGDRVVSGQALATLSRQAPSDPRAGGRAQGPQELTLEAPAGGLIMNSAAVVGAMASPQAGPLFQIIVDEDIELQVEVPSLQMPKLKPGATARISLSSGPERNGRVRLVGAEIDPQSQLGHARLSVDKDPNLRVGMFARATIDASRSCGISVPQAAIIYRTEGTSVQIVRNDTIETRNVQLGLRSDDNVEIREGLSEGDTVVANAGTSLHDGDKVRTILAQEADQPVVR